MAQDLAHPLLASLSSGLRDKLVRGGSSNGYAAKKTVLREGQKATHVFFLLSGAVRVFHRRGKREVLVKLFRAPAMFGEMEALSGEPYHEYVSTLERSQVLLVPAALFSHALDISGEFAAAVARDLARRLCIATVNERSLVFDPIEHRVSAVLLDYAAAFGVTQDGVVRINHALSQAALAQEAGGSHRAVATAIEKLRKAGMLRKREARYELVNPAALKARVNRTLGLHHVVTESS